MNKLIGFALACASVAIAAEPSGVAIRNARIVTVSGATIEKGTVVIRGGLIEAVGSDVTPPADVWVIDGTGLTVYPGLIDALSTVGIPDAAPPPTATTGRGGGQRPTTPAVTTPGVPTPPPSRGPEDRPATTSWQKAEDLIQTTDRRIETFRNGGFTTTATFPARGIFAGQGAIIDLAGEKPGQMVVTGVVGQFVTLSTSGAFGSFPGSLMGTMAYIRQIYLDADQYKTAKAMYAKNARGLSRPEYDRALEGIIESPRILLPAERAVEITRMIRFGQELKQPFVLYGAHEAYRSADVLKQAGVPVLVNLKWPEKNRESDPDEIEPMRTLDLRDKAPGAPAALANAGVLFAFYDGGVATPRELMRAVKRAIDAGLKPEDAVRAMTLSPAQIYGVADRLGSIEKGKIANLVITNGELFQDKTEVKYVFVDGEKFEPAPEPPPVTPRGRETQ
jgi:imidazolonepropionase-like amidohydrolase